MTEAVAAELRAELGRQKLSMREFSRRSSLPLTTLQRTLSGKRAIDVDELFEICDWLEVDAGDLIARAEKVARAEVDDGLLIEERLGVDPSAHRSDYGVVANDSIAEHPPYTDSDFDNA